MSEAAKAEKSARIKTIQILCWRMKKRAEGRSRIRAAEEKRKKRAAFRALSGATPKRKHLGVIDDAEFGEKPKFYAKGVLYKDGLGNKVLEVLK